MGAGSGAPGFSCVGSLTYPPSPKGFSDLTLDQIGLDAEDEVVLTGTSGSLRDQPSEFIESRKAFEAMSRLFGRPPTSLVSPPRAWCVKLVQRTSRTGPHDGTRRRQQPSSTPPAVGKRLSKTTRSACRGNDVRRVFRCGRQRQVRQSRRPDQVTDGRREWEV